jgi:glutathione S-transferase
VGQAWVNGPVVARMMPGREQIPAAKAFGERAARAFYQRLDETLSDQQYMAGGNYSVADVTALCVIDFAGALVDLKPDDDLQHLWRWHAEVAARHSAAA